MPEGFVEGVLDARGGAHLRPAMLGPPTMRSPDASADEEVAARPETEEAGTGERDGHCVVAHGAGAEDHGERVCQCMADNLNGLGGGA